MRIRRSLRPNIICRVSTCATCCPCLTCVSWLPRGCVAQDQSQSGSFPNVRFDESGCVTESHSNDPTMINLDLLVPPTTTRVLSVEPGEILSSSRRWMMAGLDAFSRDDGSEDFDVHHIGVAMEHLLKAYLASLHPAHIVEEKHWESLLHATGHTSRSGVPRSRTRTIGLKTAFDRVKRLLPKITVSAQKRPELPSLHEIHSGFLLPLGGPAGEPCPAGEDATKRSRRSSAQRGHPSARSRRRASRTQQLSGSARVLGSGVLAEPV